MPHDPNRALWESWNAMGGPKYPNEKVVQYTFRHFPSAVRATTRALDVGCGSGVNTWFLAREGFPVVASDLALSGLLNARSRLGVDNFSAPLICADAGKQPFRDGSFDYIVAVRVLELLPSPELQDALVGEIARLLVPGGRGLALFASPEDYGVKHPELAPAPFFAPSEQRVHEIFCDRFASVDIDIYMTTYQGGKLTEHNFLVTFVK